MKKICIVAPGLNDGGAERVASILANYFAEKYKVLFIAAYKKDREYHILDNVNYVYINNNYHNKVMSLIKRNIEIFKEIKKFKSDINISFITNELFLTNCFYPTIFSLRNDPSKTIKSKKEELLRKIIYLKAKYIIFQTHGAQKYFSKKIQEKSYVISNPIEIEKMPYWNYKKNSKTFISACRLTEQKNLKLMINSFTKFHKKFKEYKLEIYGDGEEKEKLNLLINNLNASDYIFLKGHTTNIHTIMANATAFLLTSDYEGLSNSMLEALCIGLPCICTDSPPGGARQFIKNGENGYLVRVGDEEEIVKSLNKIIDEDENKKENYLTYCKNIRKRISSKEICKQWEEICKKVVRKNDKKDN